MYVGACVETVNSVLPAGGTRPLTRDCLVQHWRARVNICAERKRASRQVDAALIAPDGTRQVTRYTLADERGRWRVVRMSPSMGFDASRAAEIVQCDGAQAVLAWMDRGLARYPQLPKA